MTDTTTDVAGAADQPTPLVRMLAHFTRDLSFENVGAIEGTPAQGQPDITVNVGMDAKEMGEERFQVSMKINAKAVANDTTRFLVELDYAGVFELDNVKKEHRHPFLFIECPRQLLPFARRVIADATRDGGYPPLMLDNVDFVQLYRQRMDAVKAKMESQKADDTAAADA